MRRILSISMALLFSWMFVAPLLPALLPSAFGAASVGDASLPVCCRRGGRHHCIMVGRDSAAPASFSAAQLTEKCPYFPHATTAALPFAFNIHAREWTDPTLLDRPGTVSQVEVSYRVAASRSHQKRGPPATL